MGKYMWIIVFSVLFLVFGTTVSILASETIVGTAPGVPANQYLNDRLDWKSQVKLYNLCKKYGVDYYFALAVIEQESHFNISAYNPETIDRGLMQVNKQWISKFKKLGFITSYEDLYDPLKNIECGMYLLGDAVAQYGNTEKAYAYYNTGNPNVNSNKSSRKVMEYWEEWRERFETK